MRWCSANARSAPDIVSTGTYVLDRNENGMNTGDSPWASCALPATSPKATNTQVNARRVVRSLAPAGE